MNPTSPEMDPRLDRALDTVPLAPLPSGFVRRTVQRLPAPRPRFRLDFLDVALSAFLLVFAASLALAGFWLANLVDPLWLLEVRTELAWLLMYTSTRFAGWLPLVGLASAGLLGMAVLAATMVLLRPAGPRPIRPLR